MASSSAGHGPLEKLGYLFYVASPNKTSFETPEEVPNYIVEVVPYFALLIILEQAFLFYKGKSTLRVNDAFGSVSQGMLQELSRVVVKNVRLVAYLYIYHNWRLVTLPWNSVWTWWICFLGVDLAYYWLHRASHEINILWAAHQVHHSSEDYNLSTALRQSVFQNYSVWMFYLPMALAIPPSVFLVHDQFNLLYQFWIHTEAIKSLGPLEYIFNTASHHRVHHGRNRYCIDKNYGGTLIIWDRIFGTFEAEGEEVVYGLTHPLNSFQPITIQLCHYMHIWKTFWHTPGLTNKLSVLIKGPGWSPGTPWHGYLEDIPEVKAPAEKYDPQLHHWGKIYIFLHFVLITLLHLEITERNQFFTQTVIISVVAYQVFSLITMGALLERSVYAPAMELVRCILFFVLDYYFLPISRLGINEGTLTFLLRSFTRITFIISAIFSAWTVFKSIKIQLHLQMTNKVCK